VLHCNALYCTVRTVTRHSYAPHDGTCHFLLVHHTHTYTLIFSLVPLTSSSFYLLPPYLFSFIHSFFSSPLQLPYFLLILTSISPYFSSLLCSLLLFSTLFSLLPLSSSFPFSSSPSSTSLSGAAWHKACFKCGDGESLWGCSRGLTQDNYSQYGGWPFCKACYTKNFKQGESVSYVPFSSLI
jgi:LIM domain